MTYYNITLVLFAALLHASWNTIVKSNKDRLLSLSIIMIVGGLMALPLLFVFPLPQIASWLYIIASVIIHLFYCLYLVKAYEFGDLSIAYPVARGSAPLLVSLGAWLFANEIPSMIGLLGILITSIAIISLSYDAQKSSILTKHNPKNIQKSVIAALITGLLISAYTVVDGMGVRLSGSPVSYIIWLFILQGITMATVIFCSREMSVIKVYVKDSYKIILYGSFASLLSYGLIIYTMSQTQLGLVSALRETSVIFATIIGVILLKEKVSKLRWASVIFVTLGVCLLIFG